MLIGSYLRKRNKIQKKKRTNDIDTNERIR
jgi:hypothetical protein